MKEKETIYVPNIKWVIITSEMSCSFGSCEEYSVLLNGYRADPYRYISMHDEIRALEQALKNNTYASPSIEKVIFNPPATIVFWKDGSKTVVKCQDCDEFDPEKGLAMAFMKRSYGNTGKYWDEVKKWVEPYEGEYAKAHVDYDRLGDAFKRVLDTITTPSTVSCYNCKYIKTPPNMEPCVSCGSPKYYGPRSKFEPKEAE